MNEIALSILAGTLLILLLIAVIVITFFMASRQRGEQDVKLAETKLNFEKEIRLMESEVSEELMAQFSNELHDNVGQLLTVMHIEIENQKLDFPESEKKFDSLAMYLGEVTQQLRLLGKTMNTDFIGDSGLILALEVEVERLNSLRRFSVKFEVEGAVSDLENDQELIVFRIFQEVAQNALKHSEAKTLVVKLKLNDFQIEIWDDGKGFDYLDMLENNKVSGLRNIKKRADLAKLECDISSKLGEGTRTVLKKIATPI
jgi:two-component system NarL family sensor kinase